MKIHSCIKDSHSLDMNEKAKRTKTIDEHKNSEHVVEAKPKGKKKKAETV